MKVMNSPTVSVSGWRVGTHPKAAPYLPVKCMLCWVAIIINRAHRTMQLLQFGKFDYGEIINKQCIVLGDPHNKNIRIPHIVNLALVDEDVFGVFWIPNFDNKLLALSKSQCIHIPDLGQQF